MKAQNTSAYHNVGGAASAGGEDVYALLKAQELADSKTWRPIQAYAFYATADCTVTINDASPIPVFADVPLSGTGQIISLVLNTAGITYSFVAEY